MNFKHFVATSAAAVLLTVTCPASAVVTFSGTTANPANNTLLVDTTGTLVTAVNFGGANTVNNGVSFTGISAQNGVNGGVTFAHSGLLGFGGAATVNGSSTADPLFMTLVYFGSQFGPSQLAVSGLDAGKNYLVEFMWGEGRTIYNGVFDHTLTGSTSNTNSFVNNFTFGGATPNGSETKKTTRFTLSGEAGFNLSFVRDGGNLGPGISGYQIRELASIPEPATATLGLLSVAGLIMRRRRMA